MSGQDFAWLAELHERASNWARETGVRQRIFWARNPGYLAPCSDNFDNGFCCGERPWKGWAWVIEGSPRRDAS